KSTAESKNSAHASMAACPSEAVSAVATGVAAAVGVIDATGVATAVGARVAVAVPRAAGDAVGVAEP
ncbi:MAG: hypothetical protein OXF04_05625, partial [bacterium]|nr:hypothetical protein [bacterium]